MLHHAQQWLAIWAFLCFHHESSSIAVREELRLINQNMVQTPFAYYRKNLSSPESRFIVLLAFCRSLLQHCAHQSKYGADHDNVPLSRFCVWFCVWSVCWVVFPAASIRLLTSSRCCCSCSPGSIDGNAYSRP